jgi:uncharacterized phosphosugar-binding protein
MAEDDRISEEGWVTSGLESVTPQAGDSPPMAPSARAYLDALATVLEKIERTQGEAVEQAARVCARAIGSDRFVHVFGTGHSRVIAEEMWPRFGSYPGFHPIIELSVGIWPGITGANGQRQAMFLENVSGFAASILRNFSVSSDDVLIAASSSGTNVVTGELAELMKARGLTVIALTSVDHSNQCTPKLASGKRLHEIADLVLDMCAPVGDAAVAVNGVKYRVGPTTTVAACAIANALKVRTAELLAAEGATVRALPHAALVERAEVAAAFDEAYDEHARRTAVLQRW